MIAEQIGKNASVVCRELQRNCDNRSGEYKAELAEKKCRNRHKIKSKKIRFTSDIQFLVKRLKELLISIHDLSMATQKNLLESSLIAWIGNGKQIDDVTILGIRI